MKQLNARQLARELNIRGWTCVRSTARKIIRRLSAPSGGGKCGADS